MTRVSAGILLFRQRPDGVLEVLLAHFGGPFFKAKDLGAWAVPKGEALAGEDLLQTAAREFAEELGAPPPTGPLHPLGSVTQKSGKVVHAWAVSGDFDPASLRSNTFELEWPRGSGRLQSFPEIDRVGWFDLAQARRKILASQLPFLDRLEALEQ